ncbi:MAG: hypothetical protein GTN65_14020, partial [Armatimonadetes bacterium]|nr:hypothetical protein [Armatimonadota bacterium]NIO98176.1 hypothetical protein [Armatimonadota bacterium]
MSLHRYQKSPSRYATVVLLAVIVVCSGLGISQSPAWAARISESESGTVALKPYMPFDEPKPKIPKEILSDARLDQKVKVFVKSKNFKQLFAELSEKTGVKLGTTREISGERAIIYFHKRPLRDVMTEISGLYGYHWLVKGKKGEYRY